MHWRWSDTRAPHAIDFRIAFPRFIFVHEQRALPRKMQGTLCATRIFKLITSAKNTTFLARNELHK
jgi:hypothetical protein